MHHIMLKGRFKNAAQNAKEFFKENPIITISSLISIPVVSRLIFNVAIQTDRPVLNASAMVGFIIVSYIVGLQVSDFHNKKKLKELSLLNEFEKLVKEREKQSDLTQEDNIDDVLDTPAFRP